MAVYKGRQARGPAGQTFKYSLAMSLLGVNMNLSEIITSLEGLRFELEKQREWFDYDYYCEVLAEANLILVDLDR